MKTEISELRYIGLYWICIYCLLLPKKYFEVPTGNCSKWSFWQNDRATLWYHNASSAPYLLAWNSWFKKNEVCVKMSWGIFHISLFTPLYPSVDGNESTPNSWNTLFVCFYFAIILFQNDISKTNFELCHASNIGTDIYS